MDIEEIAKQVVNIAMKEVIDYIPKHVDIPEIKADQRDAIAEYLESVL
jgi:hypothetical protein